MELYESATLSDWLASKDRVVDTESNMLIFTQLGSSIKQHLSLFCFFSKFSYFMFIF